MWNIEDFHKVPQIPHLTRRWLDLSHKKQKSLIDKYKCIFVDRYVILFFLCLSTPLFSLGSFLFFQIQIIYLSSLFLDMQPCSKQLPSNCLKQFSKGKTGIYSSASPRCCLPRFHFSNPLLAKRNALLASAVSLLVCN